MRIINTYIVWDKKNLKHDGKLELISLDEVRELKKM